MEYEGQYEADAELKEMGLHKVEPTPQKDGMEYTKGEWKVVKSPIGDWAVAMKDILICREARHYNAHLIAAAPLGYKLADFVSHISATWIENGLLEIGEGDYTRMKAMALDFISKASGK